MNRIKVRPSDALFSKIVRTKAGWKCERCGKQFQSPTQGLHCSHFHGRSHENTRHDLMNAASICYGCHAYFHANPQEHSEWFEKRIGKKEFVNLRIRANLFKKKDDKLTMMGLKLLAKEYGIQ